MMIEPVKMSKQMTKLKISMSQEDLGQSIGVALFASPCAAVWSLARLMTFSKQRILKVPLPLEQKRTVISI